MAGMNGPNGSLSRLRQFQIVVSTLVGTGIVTANVLRDSWNPLSVTLAAACLGVLASEGLARILLGRFSGNGGAKK